MQTRLEAAVAGEVLAEVKRQRFTYKEIQERAGIKPRVWTYYFTAGDRPIPFAVLASVCEVLGVKPSAMIARAEAQVEAVPSMVDSGAEIEAGLSESDRELLNRLRAERAKDGEDRTDPKGRARADQDDGVVHSARRFRRTA